MTRADNPRLRRVVRLVLVTAVTASTLANIVQVADLTAPVWNFAAALAAVACAIVLTEPSWSAAPRIPWFTGPAAVTFAAAVIGWPMLPLMMVPVFDLAVAQRVRTAAVCVAAVLLTGLLAPGPWRQDGPDTATGSAVFAVVFAVGLWVGQRRRRMETLHREIEHLRVERALGEDRTRQAERARIALEMHDVLAHRLSLIALHSGVLEQAAPELPERVRERLMLLRAASTDALTDLRDVLGALRASETAPLRPALTDLGHLVDDARANGQRVDFAETGNDFPVSTSHHLAVQRIVQEGLTNARKHAHGSTVTVHIDRTDTAVTVTVTSTPGHSTAPQAPPGFGLVGLGERVRALGGFVESGHTATGDFSIRAVLPRTAAPAAGSDA